jgi:DNA-binding response OmpR family regulator
MKILACGHNPLITRKTTAFASLKIDWLEFTQTQDVLSVLENYEKPDMVIIRKNMKGAVFTANLVQALWDSPIVLFVEGEDWEGLEEFMADGYVKDSFSNSELIARLTAIQRRTARVKRNPTGE